MSYLNTERLAAIETRLVRDGRVIAAELARDFSTSEDTIRRDLRALAAQGRCRRVYGGALPVAPGATPVSTRLGHAAPAKAALGGALAGLIEPGMTVFLDVGTTTSPARALADRTDLSCVTLITHAPLIAAALVEVPGVTLVAIGGRVDPVVGAAIGARALMEIEGLRPDLLLLGACGLDPAAGLTAHSIEDASVKRALATRSGAVATAGDRDKLGTAAAFPVIDVAACDILALTTDCPPELRAALGALGPLILDVECAQ